MEIVTGNTFTCYIYSSLRMRSDEFGFIRPYFCSLNSRVTAAEVCRLFEYFVHRYDFRKRAGYV